MIYVPPIPELSLIGVHDRGKANNERIVIRATQPVETSAFAILVGFRAINSHGIPVTQPAMDHFLWFGNGFLRQNDWVFVYTGSGESRKTTIPGSNDTAYVVHWGKQTTLFANPLTTPVIVRVGAMLTEAPPADQLQHRA